MFKWHLWRQHTKPKPQFSTDCLHSNNYILSIKRFTTAWWWLNTENPKHPSCKVCDRTYFQKISWPPLIASSLRKHKIKMSYIKLIHDSFSFACGATANWGTGHLNVEVSRSHSDKPHSVGLLWTRDRPVAETSTSQHVRHPQHTQTGSNSSTIAADNSTV
jgi:hypothetical protein